MPVESEGRSTSTSVSEQERSKEILNTGMRVTHESFSSAMNKQRCNELLRSGTHGHSASVPCAPVRRWPKRAVKQPDGHKGLREETAGRSDNNSQETKIEMKAHQKV